MKEMSLATQRAYGITTVCIAMAVAGCGAEGRFRLPDATQVHLALTQQTTRLFNLVETSAGDEWQAQNSPPIESASRYTNPVIAAIATGESETLRIVREALDARVQAAHDDLSPDLDDEEYQAGLTAREQLLQQSVDGLETARSVLATAKMLMDEGEANLLAAISAFADVELSGDREALDTAWSAVSSALSRYTLLAGAHEELSSDAAEAENNWEKNSIWLEKYKNDYEAQSETFAVRDGIALCGSTDCSATDFLDDERFSIFQPHVLEMVGVHHAFAKGLTGKGVRIGIEDDVVNYRLPEFAERISFAGAVLTYPVIDGDNQASEAKRCELASASERESLKCTFITFSSERDQLKELTARWTVANFGWPEEGGNIFIRNDAYEEGSWVRWVKIPHGSILAHGTAVASVAAGRDFGVAPGATVVPIARDFSQEGQTDQRDAESTLLLLVSLLPELDRREIDSQLAETIKADYANYDVINRSFGIGVFDPASISAVLNDETQWWGEGLREILPQTWRAYMQTGTNPDDRTIVVYATGNQTQEFGGFGAEIPFYEPHVRGSQLAVMAVDHDGFHADYTNFCGPLPPDWDASRWGRHFCLAAPGTVNAVGSAGMSSIVHEAEGTSFAAPVVTGSIALLMEHFRGQLGNTEIVKRVVNTANNRGHYAQMEIYGAGLLDIEAALQPVGETTTGTPSQHDAAGLTSLSLPPAFGNLGRRLRTLGVEVASLDSLGAPFWSSPERFMNAVPIPPNLVPAVSLSRDVQGGYPHLGFTPGTIASPFGLSARTSLVTAAALGTGLPERATRLLQNQWRHQSGTSASEFQLLMGKDKFGVEKTPIDGLRWGVLRDTASWLGGYSSGAFGIDVGSVTTWVGRSTRIELSDSWALSASGTLVLGSAFLRPGTMLDVDPYAMSAWDIGLERGIRGWQTWSRISLSQPLRAETGKGSLTYLAGLKDGAPFYDHATVPLEPRGRELELAVTHEAPIGWGRGIVEVAYSLDFLHEPGRANTRIGFAYRLSF